MAFINDNAFDQGLKRVGQLRDVDAGEVMQFHGDFLGRRWSNAGPGHPCRA